MPACPRCFVYGETINEEKLGMVEKAEQLLLDLGFYQVRVRIHDKMARIEILPSEFQKLLAEGVCEKIYIYFKELWFYLCDTGPGRLPHRQYE